MREIKIVRDNISKDELFEMSKEIYGDLVKAVVDVRLNIMAAGGELHADEEQLLLEQGSRQEDLWGINIYPQKFKQEGWIEFDSMINIRPAQRNRSRGVDDLNMRENIKQIVEILVK